MLCRIQKLSLGIKHSSLNQVSIIFFTLLIICIFFFRHTPSPGDIKANAALPPVDLYQHLAPSRGKEFYITLNYIRTI